MELAPGTVLLGKYRVDEVLGVGGMGRVVRASHLYLQQSFAIKLLLPAMLENPQTVTRFLREAQATSRLKSEHIVRVLDVGTMPDGVPFMVMEHLEGSDLNQILRHHGPQLPGVVCDLVLQACEGLAEAHALGFVHRDIKPSNFYVTRRPDGSMLLKILDFGISKVPVGGEDLTGAHAMLGTPTYAAPEQLRSGREVDRRSDIWSLGVVSYQLLEGRAPFAGETFAELLVKVTTEQPEPMIAQLPPGLAAVIHRCLAKDPSQRQQDVGELARMLAPFASDPVVGAQIAARTTRIVQLRASQASLGQQAIPTSAGGGLAPPEPLSPAPHTPLSWPAPGAPPVLGSERARRPRGWLLAGVLVVALVAGAAVVVVVGGVDAADRIDHHTRGSDRADDERDDADDRAHRNHERGLAGQALVAHEHHLGDGHACYDHIERQEHAELIDHQEHDEQVQQDGHDEEEGPVRLAALTSAEQWRRRVSGRSDRSSRRSPWPRPRSSST